MLYTVHMNYRYLGKSGLRVSELCLGAMTFGRENEATEEESFQMMDHFVAAGGNFIDTANVYSAGISEEIVGHWLKKQRRDDLVIATKVRFPMGTGPNHLGLSRKHILSSAEASLRRLQTDYIDLYQVHCWDERTPLEETLSSLNDLVRKGVVRYVGASNFAGWQLQRAIDLQPREWLGGFDVPSAAVQFIVPQHRMGAYSAVRAGRTGRHSVEPAPGWLAFREVQARDDRTARRIAHRTGGKKRLGRKVECLQQ